MKKHPKSIVVAVALLFVVIAELLYTRPQTIEERYPVLDMSACTQIIGYYDDGSDAEQTRFVITPDAPHFDEMIETFRAADFKTRLRNLFPAGTKIHKAAEGDFAWEVMFEFEDVAFPSGDTGSGCMLRVDNFFGKLNLFFDGEEVKCSVRNQEQWLKEVMEIIMQDAD